MGTTVRIVIDAENEQRAAAGAKAAFERIASIERCLSDYRDDSEAMKLCRANDAAPGRPLPVSNDLAAVLGKSLELSKATSGAFDVTIGPMSKLWREARKKKTLPGDSALDDARARVGWSKLTLDARAGTVMLREPGMRLDFGGIGKGYAADEALKVLRGRGIRSAMIACSGDIAVGEPPPGRDGWIIDVAPLNPGDPPRKLLLKNAAVSTSGDLHQHVEIAGVRYSHVLDPQTGLGLTGFRSATVIAKDAATADALATAAAVLPAERSLTILDTLKAEAFIAVKATRDGRVETNETAGFKSHELK